MSEKTADELRIGWLAEWRGEVSKHPEEPMPYSAWLQDMLEATLLERDEARKLAQYYFYEATEIERTENDDICALDNPWLEK